MKTIKIGDTVVWKGCFGLNAPLSAKVTGMELTAFPRCKYGHKVKEVSLEAVKANLVVFSLDNGHWAYSEQIEVWRKEVLS